LAVFKVSDIIRNCRI